VFTVKIKLQLNTTNEIIAADAAADNNSNSSSDDIFEVTSRTLTDSDSPAQILACNNCTRNHGFSRTMH